MEVARGRTIRQALAIAHLSRHAPARIFKLFDETGDLHDRDRPGRPVKYTDALVDKAVQLLVSDQRVLHTAKTFIALLRGDQLVSGPVSQQALIGACKRRLRAQGTTLITGSTGSRFLLTKADANKRVAFAKEMLPLLRSDPRSVFVCLFVDETTLEQSPHPKSGEFLLRTGIMPSPHACIMGCVRLIHACKPKAMQ